ncbi:N-6 DNA methylase [Thermomicrobiaceae bacterium CFH 74404]|uniref:site-specific DNA-methyltransferase (adenine-specific) n=1 Tax=Thermalbibacter longus TaxID=2951981 RepID=A0AA41WF12_9BACT|nr:type ISP restriction/modification enzyme [Thermalbibacter longus]MCM8749379.1 N-6 DNA methylase [Thermalbibacter longus]
MAFTRVFKDYLRDVTAIYHRGDAREESFYDPLARLLQAVASLSGRQDIAVTILPRPTEAGNPDFRVWNGRDRIVGYVEAKHPDVQNLDQVETSEQLQRYLDTFPNLILTNFLEFRLYRSRSLVAQARLARPYTLRFGQVPPVEHGDELTQLLEQFLSFALPAIQSAETLAIELAKRTRFLREVVLDELRQEQAIGHGNLLGFYEAFKQHLLAQLSEVDFADLYAQTITYGLFAARTRAQNGFNRRMAFYSVPRTVGILRDVFRFISLEDPPAQIEWIVDDIAEVLAVADVVGVLHQFYRERRGQDPIVHFYETFLAAYDPEERERRGVYYTPEPVVDYIVRSLHRILQDKFGRNDGLADPGVTLLDPAAGTMTFPARACQLAVQAFEQKYGSGGRREFIRSHLLRHFYAFELMMAPYAVGHLKMAFYLDELGYHLQDDERFQLYLTNTLEMEELQQTNLPGMASLAEESRLAGLVKKKQPILVILGNPPYSGHSANKGQWILQLIEEYKRVDGRALGERNPKWLQDDYVKFLRFAQWKIEQTGRGVVGMITNHSYLDNPTFRGMRSSLLRSFDEIYVLNLHGNSLRRERAPDGSEDENVFDIRQGVAIAFFVKHGAKAPEQPGRVFHAELWGTREAKYAWLQQHDVSTTEWREVAPRPAFYLFQPRDEIALHRYEQFVKVTEIFPVNVIGIQTHRDHFAIDFDQDALMQRIRTFLNPRLTDDMVRETFNLRDNRDWKLSEKRKLLQDDQNWERAIVPILYRPFDRRWIFYHHHAIDFGRRTVMRHMLAGENVALNTVRQTRMGKWAHAVISDTLTSAVYVEIKDGSNLFPLYLYPDSERRDLFSQLDPRERRPNVPPGLLQQLADSYGREPMPEDILAYVYAILYAPSYREKYADFLKTDFPRIPFTADPELFGLLAGLGRRLIDLHLLRSRELDPPLARFEGEGDNSVARTRREGFNYDPATECLSINTAQHFAPVPLEVWEYQLGGYQVVQKWLKDRAGRQLSLDEIRTYCRIVTALHRTIAIQDEIDELYPNVEEQLIILSSLAQSQEAS